MIIGLSAKDSGLDLARQSSARLDNLCVRGHMAVDPEPTGSQYLFSVAAGVPPAVEPGILPRGSPWGFRREFRVQRCHSGRQDAALYGSQDGCRYNPKPALNTYSPPGLGSYDGAPSGAPRCAAAAAPAQGEVDYWI